MPPPQTDPSACDVASDNSEHLSELQKILLERRKAAFGLTSLLLLATLFWTASYEIRSSIEASSPTDGRPCPQSGINPNTARWFELAQLPGIGETLARRMEGFRRRNRSQTDPNEPVFRVPVDLARVKGIGDKTVRRIGPFLRFPESGGTGKVSAGEHRRPAGA